MNFQPFKGLSVEIHYNKTEISQAIADLASRWIMAATAASLELLHLLVRLAIASGLRAKNKLLGWISPSLQRWTEEFSKAKTQIDEHLNNYLEVSTPLQLSAVQEPQLLLSSGADVLGVPADSVHEVVEDAEVVPAVEFEATALPLEDAETIVTSQTAVHPSHHYETLDLISLRKLAKGRIAGYFRLNAEELAERLAELDQAVV